MSRRVLAGMSSAAGGGPGPTLEPYAFLILCSGNLATDQKDANCDPLETFKTYTTLDATASGFYRRISGARPFDVSSVYDPRLDSYAYEDSGAAYFEFGLPAGDYVIDPGFGSSFDNGTTGSYSLFDGMTGNGGTRTPVAGVQGREQAVPQAQWCDGKMDGNNYSDVNWLARDPAVRGDQMTVSANPDELQQGASIQFATASNSNPNHTFYRLSYVRVYSVV